MTAKVPAFTNEEKLDMLRRVTAHISNVEIGFFDGLLVNYVQQMGAQVIIKGLRAVSDFEYELQMALMNQKQQPGIETLFMMTSSDNSFLSSSIVKEVARLGGNLNGMVPEMIIPDITKKLLDKGDH